MQQKICRKCLLEDLTDQVLYEKIMKAKERIPEEERTAAHIYEERLTACRNCEELFSGMCRICGCYVEVRAGIGSSECPAVHPRW